MLFSLLPDLGIPLCTRGIVTVNHHKAQCVEVQSCG